MEESKGSLPETGILHITSKVVDTFFDEPKWS
jgi:hypothetical protein